MDVLQLLLQGLELALNNVRNFGKVPQVLGCVSDGLRLFHDVKGLKLGVGIAPSLISLFNKPVSVVYDSREPHEHAFTDRVGIIDERLVQGDNDCRRARGVDEDKRCLYLPVKLQLLEVALEE